MTSIVTIGDIAIGGANPIALILGPCQLDSRDHARMMAERIAEACAPTGTRFIFKASYDKANRSSLATTRGLGMETGLQILGDIGKEFGRDHSTVIHSLKKVEQQLAAGAGTLADNIRDITANINSKL